MRSFIFLILLSFAFLFWRLFRIFLYHGSLLSSGGVVASPLDVGADFYRADIVDRNGVALARNVGAYDLYVNANSGFSFEKDFPRLLVLFPDLSSRSEKIFDAISARASQGKSSLVLIKKGIFPYQRDKALEEGIVGIEFQEVNKRVYLHNRLLSHVLGFISSDNQGLMGIERYFNDYLLNPANKGKPLRLSVDVEVQYLVRDAIAALVKKYDAKGAFGLILKIDTGEVISAVSLPDFNPNLSHDYSPDELFNKFSLGVYELGSVFKLLLGSVAVKEGLSMSKKYDIPKRLDVDNFVIENFRTTIDRPSLTIPEMIRYSSNTGCASVAVSIPADAYKDFFKKLGMNERTAIQLPERGYPIFPRDWAKSTIMTSSYGHGLAVTPLHFVSSVASVLGDGILIEPTLLKVSDVDQIKTRGSIVSKLDSERIRQMFRIVESGKRSASSISYYDVVTKSGTAIIAKGLKSGYNRDSVILSFVVAGPLRNPQYVFYFGLQEPSFVKTGGSRLTTGANIIGPVAVNIVKQVGPMIGMKVVKSGG